MAILYPAFPLLHPLDRHNVTIATFDSTEKPGVPKPHRFVRQKEFELPVGTVHSKHAPTQDMCVCTYGVSLLIVASVNLHTYVTQLVATTEERREPAPALMTSALTHTDGTYKYRLGVDCCQ